MPLPENSAIGSLHLLQNYLTQHTDQQALQEQFSQSGNNHQLAICFTFPEGFKIDLKVVKQGTPYGERVMRLCESVNQPDTIKADIWTRSTNNGTLSGVRPGIPVQGEPIPPEDFLYGLNYTLVSFVFPGPKFGGGKAKQFTGLKGIIDAIPVIQNPNVPPGQAFLVNTETMTKAQIEAKYGTHIDLPTEIVQSLKKKPVKKSDD